MSELIGYLSEVEHLKGELTIPKIVGGGGGDTPVIESLSVTPTTSQQTYNDSEVDGYKPVVVNPIPSEYIVPTGTKNITQNGTGIDVAAFASANVNVPNSYSASDEGKVVDDGALIAQTAHADVTPTTSDQTINTTTNNSIKVKGDADLVAANIKKDVEIFGVTGSYEGGGGGAGAVTQDQNGYLVLSPDAGGGGGGVTLGPMDYPVIIQNGRTSGTIAFRAILYDSTVDYVTTNSNITAGSNITINNALTDGTYVWFFINNVSNITYNGQPYTDYLKSSSNWKLKIPSGFDGTIPFIFQS